MSIKFPSTVGACIDKLYEIRAQRLDMQKQIDAVKAMEAQYEEHILNQFDKSEINGAKGDVATAGIKRTTVFQIADWDAFTAYVAATGSWDLMRKQAGATACAERFENGEEVPGIEPFVKIGLSLNKAGK